MVDLIVGDLQIVLLFVNVTIRAVVVLVLEVFEAFLCIERGEKLAVSNLHVDEVHGERRQLLQRHDMFAALKLLQLLSMPLALSTSLWMVLISHFLLFL